MLSSLLKLCSACQMTSVEEDLWVSLWRVHLLGQIKAVQDPRLCNILSLNLTLHTAQHSLSRIKRKWSAQAASTVAHMLSRQG